MFLVQINLTDNICGVRTRWEILLVWCVAVVSPDHQLGQGWPGPPSPAQPSLAQPSPAQPSAPVFRSVSFCRASPAQPCPAQPSPVFRVARPRHQLGRGDAGWRCGRWSPVHWSPHCHFHPTLLCFSIPLWSHSYRQPQHALTIYLHI